MKNKISISIYPLILIAFIFILTNSCKKDDNSTSKLPTVTTDAAPSYIDINDASFGGSVTSEGASAVTHKGLCWSGSPAPDLGTHYSDEGFGPGY